MISLYSYEEIYEMIMNDLKQESMEEGRKEGRKEGRAEGREDVAIEMIKDNEEPSKISRFTHLSLERINELKALLSNNMQLANE